ncbi:hypothetical protein [Kitasatospora sp. NPDC050543]|uniref:hypothetical protein n=1 Tax=Kitasatospora sp. NPDC050543 TaxID=3364054 RepID=UPI00379CB03C
MTAAAPATGAQPTPGGVPALFRGLFDDAAIFPPGDLPMAQAVPAHRAHRAAWYADAVGSFLCGAGRLGELAEVTGGPLRVGLVLPGGSTDLPSALKAAAPFELAGVELAAQGAREAVAALAEHLPAGVPAVVELPRGEGAEGRAGLEAELDVLAGSPYRVKFRTGGLAAGAFPTEAELAGLLAACAERGLPFKCTAGLHNAVRHTDPVTGFEHHGFLNVLLAALATDRAAAAEALRERSGTVLAGAVAALTERQITTVRGAFLSFGTCSIAEPLHDLAALGLLPPSTPHLEDR